ncbi:MAG TPA: RAMP superfamily CRISPR-associated protein, partial [Kofleriaceae bacterium]
MSHFALTVRFPGGGPLVGGAATTPQGFHASHAELPDGRPYIPATALRGALREALEAVLRGTGEHRACAGGDGIDPERTDTGVPVRRCDLGIDGAPCLACRLFGTRRAAIGANERAFSGLVLGDAMPVGEPRWTTRPSVALARASRSASDKQLVFQRVPEADGGAPLTFTAHGRVSDESLSRYLEAATRATTHVGSGRSRGLARVELELAWREPPGPATHAASVLATESDILIQVTLT